ncbi:MAG: L-threonylcarbamoyladenylate synthase [Bacteroidetes bacterium]|nr:L-threonylcarbamoyladenylate synthase [Bacteroidota bacterium]
MEEEIKKCIYILQTGGTILYPTDTIWGIGCDATNMVAVDKIYHLKRRMEQKSLIVLLDDAEKLSDYVAAIPEIAGDLIKKADTPLTIIYPEAKNLAKNVIAEDGSVAIRIVRTEFCRRLIHEFGKPIVSTSANISGKNPPLTFRNISDEIILGVDHVVEESMDQIYVLKPSRIIKLEQNGEFTVIRN